MNRSLIGCLILLLAHAPFLAAAPPGVEPALGPFIGRNMYAPHLPWYSFPGGSARAHLQGDLHIRSGLYYLNEFKSYPFDPDGYTLNPDGTFSAANQEDRTAMDYESTIWEIGLSWQAFPQWRFSIDWRLHARYGGIMDSFIEEWHSLLGVANAGREYFTQNQSYWNIRTSNGISFGGEGSVIASGDLDIGATRTLWQNFHWAMAWTGVLKIPTGKVNWGFSSGFPDIAASFAVDFRPWTRWAFYLTSGIIIPTDGVGLVMLQFIPSVEFRAARGLSILFQINIQSSPIRGEPSEAYVHPVFGNTSMFTLPQTNIKFGVKGQAGNWGWQFYFEEDPFTWEGPDILINFAVSYNFKTISSL